MKTRSQTRNEKLVAKPVVVKVKTPIEKMKTRYQTRNAALAQPIPEIKPESKVLQNFFVPSEPMIDFDDASACWRANKKHLGNGMFKYVCPYMKDDNQRCGRNVKNGNMTCHYH
jgi:hypothetical protein